MVTTRLFQAVGFVYLCLIYGVLCFADQKRATTFKRCCPIFIHWYYDRQATPLSSCSCLALVRCTSVSHTVTINQKGP
uniref:Uncharacterized protein n=1 Tax=Helianthus annuus TaxID=4232 RepID=A0A251SI19_HELAN